tara:strand:- start:798 stop:1901 length:1104 start_codon:yes stop_codon:yes gene_type:complete
MASEFNLEVAINAKMDKFESDMRRAEQAVDKSTQSMENNIKSTGDAFDGAAESSEGFADKAVKVLAVMGAVEGGIKVLNAGLEGMKAAMAAAEGDTEALNTALTSMSDLAKSLPFGLGAIASAIEGLADSMMGVTEAEKEALESQNRLAAAQRTLKAAEKFNQTLEDGNSDLRDRLALLHAEDEFARRHNALTIERFKMERELEKLMSDASEAVGRRRVLRQSEIEERMRLIDEIIDKEKELNMIAGDKARAEAEAKQEQERQLKIKEAQAKLEKERLQREKELEKLQERRQRAEDELAKARQEAERSVQGATASFSTAGGSFTTAVSAQVNEAKILRSISQQSRDFLQQIVDNTSRMIGGSIGGFA